MGAEQSGTFIVCLVVYVQTSALQLETAKLTYIRSHLPYIWCNMTYRTSFSQSPQAFPITYLECPLSTEFPLMADWTQASTAVTLQQRRVCKRFLVSFFHFSLSVLVVYTVTNPSDCRCSKGRQSYLNEHSATPPPPPPGNSLIGESVVSSYSASAHPSTLFSQIIHFTHVWFKKKRNSTNCVQCKQLFRCKCLLVR